MTSDFVFGHLGGEHVVSDEMVAFLTTQGADISSVRRVLPVDEELVDDSLPLANYFISTSHNTYLLAHQVLARSSIAPYTAVLAGHARCVEIDVWPSPNGFIVTHGHAFTSSIPFSDVCLAISHAIQPDDWPVLVSLECHVDIDEQSKLCEIMRGAWRGKLVDAELEGVEPQTATPRDFRGRILLMVEYYATDDLALQNDRAESTSEHSDSEGSRWLAALRERRAQEGKSKTKVKIGPELASLGVYLRSVKPVGDDFLINPIKDLKLNILVNIAEAALKTLVPVSKAALVAHAQAHLRRVYPDGLRIFSSNQDPSASWRNGSQIVAMNWQTFDRGMQLNEALFAGTKGWVVKPPSLRGLIAQPTVNYQCTLVVDVVGASNLARDGEDHSPEWSLYARAELVHVSGSQWWQSKAVKCSFNPRANPMWQEQFTWVMSSEDELAFVRIIIQREEWGDDDHLGFFAAPLSRLNTAGEWCLARLLNKHGADTSSSLLVRFSYT